MTTEHFPIRSCQCRKTIYLENGIETLFLSENAWKDNQYLIEFRRTLKHSILLKFEDDAFREEIIIVTH